MTPESANICSQLLTLKVARPRSSRGSESPEFRPSRSQRSATQVMKNNELPFIDEEKGVVAQMSVGGAEFWLADEAREYLNFSPESPGGATVRVVMVVDDPGAAFARAVGALPAIPVGVMVTR
jgi:hypothetical protein